MLGLTWGDVNLKERTAHLSTTKNGTARVLAFTADVAEEMLKYREPSGYLFPQPSNPHSSFYNIEYYWKAALKSAGINNFRFHDLRHTCASILAMNGAELLEIADVLGHKSITMTQRYSHLCTRHKTTLTDRVFGDIAHG